MSALTTSPPWQALVRHHHEIRTLHLRELFDRDPKRFDTFSLRAGELVVDVSKNRVTGETMRL